MHLALLTPEFRADVASLAARRRGVLAWSEWPGVCVVLQAAMQRRQQIFNDIRFTIVGSPALSQRVRPELQRLGLESVRVAVAGSDERLLELLVDCNACLWHDASPGRTLSRLPDALLPALALNVPAILAAYGPAVDTLLNADAGLAMIPDVADSLLDCVDEFREFPQACRNGRSWLAADPVLDRHPLVTLADRWRIRVDERRKPDARREAA